MLRGNRLSGEVPSELASLPNLSLLRLAGNDFSGTLPPGLRDTADHDLDHDLLCLPGAGTDEDLLADCETLLAARDLLASDAVLDWRLSKPITTWQGVTVGEAAGGVRVVALDLTGIGLSGRIPSRLGELDQLVSLRLADNRLTGSIPPELGRLTRLRELLLGDNALSGAIPPELGELRSLRGLSLALNRLTGSIPEELGRLQNLRWLNLSSNHLSGRIPSALRRLEQLESVRLSHNDFADVVPADSGSDDVEPESASPALAGRHVPAAAAPDRTSTRTNPGLLADRAILLAVRDALAGTASLNWSDSTTLEQWEGVVLSGTPARVTALNLPERGLSGIVPPELGGLHRVAALRLHRNRLSGHIPPELGQLTELQVLALGSNALTGAIPPQIGDLEQLTVLHLRRNRLTGSIPRELAGLTNLRTLTLDFNALSGAVPRELAQLPNLEELQLAGNRLTGPIPPEPGALTNLSVMQLGGSEFADCIPRYLQGRADRELELDLLCDPSIGGGRDAIALMEMRDILAGSTSLNWSYAAPVSSWEGVTVSPMRSAGRGRRKGGTARETERVVGLDLSGMGLDGRLPPALGSLEKLIWLRLNDNHLSGPIPPELGQLADLREIGLESNTLTGPIPPQLGQLPNLSELWLGHNRLTGPIPPELGAFDTLKVLHLRGNAFTGCLPPLGKTADQFRTWPDGLPKCGAPPALEFSSLGDAIKHINASVDALTFQTIPDSAHNLYLQVGVQTGIFGLGALALLCISLIFNLRARAGADVTPMHCYAAACTIAVLVCETFDVHLLQTAFTVGCVTWILLGLGAGAVNHLSAYSAQAGGIPASGSRLADARSSGSYVAGQDCDATVAAAALLADRPSAVETEVANPAIA